MSFKLTNISGGQIVCDLATEGKTLRLDNRQSQTVKDNEITPHIKNLIEKGLILSEEVLKETKTKKNTASKEDSNHKKEE